MSQPRRGRWRGSVSHERGGLQSRNSQTSRQAQSQLPCRYFQRTGSCSFGAKCKFSHDQTQVVEIDPPRNNRDTENVYQESEKQKYHDWKRALRREPSTSRLSSLDVQYSVTNLEEIWSGAVGILDGSSPDLQQMLVKDLIDDKHYGYEYLHLTLMIRLQQHGDLALGIIEPFLRVITHSAVLDCLSINTYVGTLYNFISGVNGELAVAFFSDFCTGIMEFHLQTPEQYTIPRLDRILQALLRALHELLQREKRACFNEGWPGLFNNMEHIFIALESTTIADGYFALARRDRMDVLQRMVDRSSQLLATSTKGSGKEPESNVLPPAVRLAYPIETVLPLSQHDNDHLDIVNISILPTAGEITSNAPDFLPSTDFSQPHFLDNPIQRYLDTHFRLLRHDIFGPLKQVLNGVMLSFENGVTPARLPRGDMNAHLYQKARINHIAVNDRRGFEAYICFDPPPQLQRKSVNERQRWWENSKRLEQGGLVCLVCSTESDHVLPLLFIVSERCTDSTSREHSLVSPSRPTITLKLATRSRRDLQSLIQVYQEGLEGALIDIPGLLPATFMPILENLQHMTRVGELPFEQWIIPRPSVNIAEKSTHSNPPLYARTPGFIFCLDSIVNKAGRSLILDPMATSEDSPIIDEMETRTGLDRGQCNALIAALTREFALIQGPPGTGKSFLGVKLIEVLLGSKKTTDLGPIIIICYTNHALDQFLSHLKEIGITKIIRIGGQSRSPELQGHNLRVVSANYPKTKHEGYILGSTYSMLEEQMKILGKRLGALHKFRRGSVFGILEQFLQRTHPGIYDQLYRSDDGFTTVGQDPVTAWLGRKVESPWDKPTGTSLEDHLNDLIIKADDDIYSLSADERRMIADHWIQQARAKQIESLFEDITDAEDLRRSLNGVHDEVNRRTLLMADVIGITTTGLARDVSTLRRLRAKVVVCEEAAEVLEAHTISALMPGVEHFIQIGDHQQLRPQINNFSLSLETTKGMPYQLDRSQFERLALGQPGLPAVPVAQLNVQRRMRPEISSLIRNTMYLNLEDHVSVENLPDVVGIRENVFWLNHDNMEDTTSDDGRLRSHSNAWEIEMTKALVRHLIRQGEYKSTDIAILTPYAGQLQKLRASLSSDFEIIVSERDEDTLAREGFETELEEDKSSRRPLQRKKLIDSLRLATVDNFQGEEAKITVITLVRSNPQRKAGFLRTKNRINVLLSRAQYGMYIIGNADTYANIPMWVDVYHQLEEAKAVGRAFNLCCPRHVDLPIQCVEPEDFLRFSPEGGCNLPCDQRLVRCGHQCQSKCHSDGLHAAWMCPQSCPRIRLTCDHACPKLCGEECGRCQVVLDNIQLPCGHQKDRVPCFQAQTPAEILCTVLVDKTVPGCNHVVSKPCHTDVASKDFRCPTPCTHLLECRHPCRGSCGSCWKEDETGHVTLRHRRCEQLCGRHSNTCEHVCTQRCHVDQPCKPCQKRCEVRCAHSRCAMFCRDACPPCIEKCTWSCSHQGSCSMPCAAPCDRLPCNERCQKMLGCGHQCPGICGESCPEGYCQPCGERAEECVDLLEFRSYKDINLDETPIVVLSCGHFFVMETLDGTVHMDEVYSSHVNGNYISLRNPSESLSVPFCPQCKRPIRQFATQRYNRVVNMAVIDEISKKFVVRGLTELKELERRVDEAENAIQTSRKESSLHADLRVTDRRGRDELSGRLVDCLKLEKQITKFCEETSVEQQPSKKLFDAILHARRQQPFESRLGQLGLFDITRPILDKQVILYGRLARLKIQDIMLREKFFWLSKLDLDFRPDTSKTYHLAKLFFKDCEAIITESSTNSLPRLVVQGSLIYAQVATCMQSSKRIRESVTEGVGKYVDTARKLLGDAAIVCQRDFDGAAQLRENVESAQRLLRREWREEVTAEEIAAIKLAMVSGSEGINTHSGHWYNCSNGHTFAIGECGMPMELARCPECNARIGGQHHNMVAGVSRATEMET